MKYDPQKHHRKSIRLKGFDYAQEGLYYITICTCQREWLFGEVVNKEWLKTEQIRNNVSIDKYVIMPNHLHGIIHIINNTEVVGAYRNKPLQQSIFQSPSKTIGAIIRGFKSTVTKKINDLRQIPVAPVWQRNYYEHVIRDESELNRIRKYIIENPLKWQDDKYFKNV